METTTQTQHTPAPWTYVGSTLPDERLMRDDCTRNYVSIVADEGFETELDININYEIDLENPQARELAIANAKLIASAPELLKALKKVMTVLHYGIDNKSDQKEFDNSPVVKEALQAIAKAEGNA